MPNGRVRKMHPIYLFFLSFEFLYNEMSDCVRLVA